MINVIKNFYLYAPAESARISLMLEKESRHGSIPCDVIRLKICTHASKLRRILGCIKT